MRSSALKSKAESCLGFIGWNKRVLTLDDFDEYCRREKIIVVEFPHPQPGLYLRESESDVVYLSSFLSPVRKQEVAWHEVGHVIQHAPEICFYRFGRFSKTELQAQAVAACALIPLPLLKTKKDFELIEDYGYNATLIRFRARLYFRFGI